ncbi:MAG: hypothetical protein ACP5RF_02390 [Candidatus Micrarchaeia archaeon]
MPREKKNIAAKPSLTPSILVILGGIFILANGIYALALVPYVFTSTSLASYIATGLGTKIAPLTVILGLMLIGTALLMYNKNKVWSTMWSATALVFSILSMLGGGGFLIGLILTFTGSALNIFYNSKI